MDKDMPKKFSSLLLILLAIIYLVPYKGECADKNKKLDHSNIKTKMLNVGKFYDGEEGYFLSIPGGNESRCIWTYAGGNAGVPYIEVTSAKTATQKHALHPPSSFTYGFKVICVDDSGNVYNGIFPKE